MTQSQLPEEIESYRDRSWFREGELHIHEVLAAEGFIDRVGFCAALTDARRPGPSLYTAVCGRRDAYLPRNVQKDPESNLTWRIKDEIIRRRRVYYGKLRGGKSVFISRRLIPHFNVVWGVDREQEPVIVSRAS